MVNDFSEIFTQVASVRDEATSASVAETSGCDIYVFISLDVTNSARFKQEQPKLWSQVISEYYSVVLDQYGVGSYQAKLPQITCTVEFWKYIGDEVLLYCKVFERDEIYNLVKATANVTKEIPLIIAEKVRTGEIFPQVTLNNCAEMGDAVFNSLGIKATMWIAACGENPNTNRNIVYKTDHTGMLSHQSIDFLGPEIDGGFRIAKFAVKNRVIVSPFLAASIFPEHPSAEEDTALIPKNDFKTISFQTLKGIWNDRPVPIVMYSSPFQEFYSVAEYDEVKLDVYRELQGKRLADFLADKRYDIEYLDKIIGDVRLTKELNVIRNRLSDESYTAVENQEIPHPNNELHIACACFASSEKLLVHKHPDRGWEFGCTKIRETIAWKEAIESGYKLKYNLSICVEENPVPVATYTYCPGEMQRNKVALGIIVIGTLCTEESLPEGFMLVDVEGLNGLDGKTVDNFLVNARQAFKCYSIFSLREEVND